MEYDELQQIYADTEYYWGTDPNDLARRACDRAPDRSGLTAIDLGAGEGRDAVYLAERGLDVLAVDLAPNGLEKAERLAAERGVEIDTLEGDVNSFEPPEPVDVLYSIGTLQYLRPENRAAQFARFKRRTRPDGVHALFAFVERADVAPAPDWGDNEYYYDDTELDRYYEDWDRLYREEFVFDDDSGGDPHRHAAVEAIYRKPSSGNG